jgi:hypothetical protein
MSVKKSLKLVSAILLALTVLAGLGYATHKISSQPDRNTASTDGRPWP